MIRIFNPRRARTPYVHVRKIHCESRGEFLFLLEAIHSVWS